MPFPNDEQLMATAKGLVEQLKAHAKGILLSGTFTLTALASSLSIAPHFQRPLPITVRFSNSTGIPVIPDTDANADPRGMGIRFLLGDRKHTDIFCHSTPTFPTRPGAEEFLQALAAGTIGEFLGAHPMALKHVTWPKPAPQSYATERYWGVNAFKLIDKEGKATFVRWQVVPKAGLKLLSDDEKAAKGPEYLQEDLPGRLPIAFKLLAQVAEEGDVTDDATAHWPEEGKVVELGTVLIEKLEEDGATKMKYFILDPIPRIEGVELSDDPLLEMRAAVYLISGKERRAA